MELSSSDKERIQHQYDALAKKTLVGEAKSHRRTLAKRAAREVTFSDLSESELAQLFVNVNIKFTKSVSLIFTSSGCYDHHPQSWISYPLFDMTFL